MAIMFILLLCLFIIVMLSAIAKACVLHRAGAQVSRCNNQLQVQHVANDDEVTGEWAELPDDVLHLITNKLRFMEDYVRFGAVCRSWHRIFIQKEKSSDSNLPWLILRQEGNDSVFRICSPFNGKVFTKMLEDLRGLWCWGYSHGWLVIGGKGACTTLLNPLSGNRISFPTIEICCCLKQHHSISYCRSKSVHKIALSSSPLTSDVFVMAIYSPYWRLALLKPGDSSWTPIDSVTVEVSDIAYYGNKFFAIDAMNCVLVFSVTGEHIQTVVPPAGFSVFRFWEKHIVEIGRKIYIVLEEYASLVSGGLEEALNIFVFRFDEADERLTRVYDLGEWALFLQFHHSFGMYAPAYPEMRKNCVYFIEAACSEETNPYELGIYRLEDNLIEMYPLNTPRTSFLSPLFWMLPNVH